MPRRPEIGWDKEEKLQSTFAFNSTQTRSESKRLLRFDSGENRHFFLAKSLKSRIFVLRHICWPVRAWDQAAPRRTPPRRIPSHRPRWNASGSRTPASSSSSPAVRVRSAPHALLAHTYSAHRSSCRKKRGFREDVPTRQYRLLCGATQKGGICRSTRSTRS